MGWAGCYCLLSQAFNPGPPAILNCVLPSWEDEGGSSWAPGGCSGWEEGWVKELPWLCCLEAGRAAADDTNVLLMMWFILMYSWLASFFDLAQWCSYSNIRRGKKSWEYLHKHRTEVRVDCNWSFPPLSSQDERKKRMFRDYTSQKITLEAVLNTVCKKCGCKGMFL